MFKKDNKRNVYKNVEIHISIRKLKSDEKRTEIWKN